MTRLFWLAFQASIVIGLLYMGHGDPEAPSPGMLTFVGICLAALATGILSRTIDWIRYRSARNAHPILGGTERLAARESLGDPMPWIGADRGRSPPA